MDQAQARALLAGERDRLQRLLQAETSRPPAAELGDEVDDADRRNAEETGMAVDQLLRARWAALVRAEARLAAGSYGRSVRSGQAIPDERLEADPLAELTAQEAAAAERSTVEEADDTVGLGPNGRTKSRGVAIVDGATVSVAVVASRTEAELIAGMLRSHGVSAAVSADDAGGQYPQMQIEGVRVLVAPADEASARRLLDVADDDTSGR